MPGLFSRRRGSSANPPVDRNTSINASYAASQAFLHNSASTNSLSSAAAAAALRSLNTSPEPVGNIQTKRMIRRGSTSSTGSAQGGRGGTGRPGLQRNNSNGSMSERTFRSPSPGRTNGTASPVGPARDAPPVPALPANIHKRSASLDPPQRTMSPTLPRGQRGGSVDRTRAPPAARPSPIQTRLANVSESEDAGPSSPSRNFSRPMSPGAGPTTTKSYTHKAGPWFTGGSSSNTSPPALINTTGPGESTMVYDPNTRSFVQRRLPSSQDPSPTSPTAPKPKQVYDPNSRSFVSVPAASATRESQVTQAPASRPSRPIPSPVNTAIEPPPRNPARLSPTAPRSPRAAGFLQKHPSVVREDPEAEQQAEASTSAASQNGAPRPTTQASTGPAKTYTTPSASHQRSSSLDVPRRGDSANRGRGTSNSPSRSAHFSRSPVLDAAEHHVPPPRNVSPAKSALKHSPSSSVRTASPIAVFSPTNMAGPASETSEDTQSQDGFGGLKKKKSVRVSFDEQPKEINIGPAAAPPADDDDDDDDGTMKPRPALPSFGSVRRDRMQPEPAEKVTEMPPERGTSSDHALGTILQRSLDPEPPEVTSKESAGYASDESSDVEVPAVSSAANPEPATVGAGMQNQSPAAQNLDVPAIALQPPTPGLDESSNRGLGEDEDHFTPRPMQRSSTEGMRIPGGWDKEDDSDDKKVADPSLAQPAPTVPDAAQTASADDTAGFPALEQVPTPEFLASPLELSDVDEDTDDAEFSDAVEDQSDLEDYGGFASLDAIVESPLMTPAQVDTRARTVTDEVCPESPSAKTAARLAEKTAEDGEQTGGNWD